MNKSALLLFIAFASTAVLSAAAGAQVTPIITGEGWEAFPDVEYQGGHSQFARRIKGVLVLTDSTLSFQACRGPNGSCAYTPRGQTVFYDSVFFSVRIRDVQELSASTQTRSPGVGRRIMWGSLANDRTNEFLAFAFDTDRTAEAPVFKTLPTQAGAIEAKVKFRQRRLGIAIPAADSARSPQ